MKEKYTFKQWCLDNDRQSILDRWDYEKTGFGPNEITYASNKDVYIKCPNGIHESSKRKVFRITGKNSDQKDFKCLDCLDGHAQNFEDLSNQKFGELTVLCLDVDRNNVNKNTSNNQTYWICKCSCGAEISAYATALKDGRQKTCGNRSIHNLGENASNWKGGITSELLIARSSKEYDIWRKNVYSKDWYTCQCCGEYRGIILNAHHLKDFANHQDLRFDMSNGIVLCSNCHDSTVEGSFHNLYGTHGKTESELQEYINNKRKQLGINIPFDIDEYKNGNILMPNEADVSLGTWVFERFSPSEIRSNNVNIKSRFRNKEE